MKKNRPIKQAAVKWKYAINSTNPLNCYCFILENVCLLLVFLSKALSDRRKVLSRFSQRTNLVFVKIIVVLRCKHFNEVKILFWNHWPDVNTMNLTFLIPESHRNHRKKREESRVLLVASQITPRLLSEFLQVWSSSGLNCLPWLSWL